MQTLQGEVDAFDRRGLRTLLKSLDACSDRIVRRDFEQYLQLRLKTHTSTIASKERKSIVPRYRWAVAQGHLNETPVTGVTPIRREVERSPFRTNGEIAAILQRTGLDSGERDKGWNSLFLLPSEIAELLALVRERARADQPPGTVEMVRSTATSPLLNVFRGSADRP